MAERPQTEKELKIYRELHRIHQGWIAFWFILVIVAALTASFLYCIFQHVNGGPATISGALDGLFGFCLRSIIKFHFPSKAEDESKLGAAISKLLAKR